MSSSSSRWLARSVFALVLVPLGLVFLFAALLFLPSTRVAPPNDEKAVHTEAEAAVILRGVTFNVIFADSLAERVRGLSGRDSIPEFGGMLFRFDHPSIYSFWMKNMRFPIDIVWLRGNRVVFVVKNAELPEAGIHESQLPVYRPDAEADTVLEIRAGMIERVGISVGDVAEIVLP